MKRLIGATLAALLLGGVVLDADKNKPSKKNKGAKASAVAVEERSAVAVRVSWGSSEVEVIRAHYRPRYQNLPPGLAKKYARTGKLPPGWQKKMQPFPVELERRCAPLPKGYYRGVIDAHAVIYNASGVIVDVAVLF